MSLMTKDVFQNRMALDMINTLQLGMCATVQTEYCLFISDESADALSLLNHMRTKVKYLSDPTHNLGDLAISGLDHGTLGVGKTKTKTITRF